MSSPIVYWFTTEVHPWRTVAAACWALLCVPFFTFGFVLLTGFSIAHPVAWIYDSFGLFFTFKFYTTVFVLSLLVSLVIFFTLPHYSVTADVERTRFNACCSLFRWSRIPLILVCAMTGALIAWTLLILKPDLRYLTYVVDSKEFQKTVLNERHLFLIEAGMFFNILYIMRFFIFKQNYLSFPHIQRHKFLHIRCEASRIIKANLVESARFTLYFYLFYILFGGPPKLWVKRTLGIDEDTNKTALTNVFGLLDISLYWQTYVMCFTLNTVLALSAALIKVYHTQFLQFDVQNEMAGKQEKGLADAMASPQPLLLQHLAFFDFCCLCRHSKQRRQELFSLSQPGGHPRIWHGVSRVALQVIRELTQKIQDANSLVMSQVAMAGQSQMAVEEKSFLHSPRAERNGVDRQGNISNSHLETPSSQPVSKLKALISNLPFITHLMSEHPDSNSRLLFAACQMHLWAVEGLSHAACWAYTEDKYGVVQGFLPSLIYTLVDLNDAIEKHFKCTNVSRRPQTVFNDSPDALLPHRLHSVTRTAIYRIVNTYNLHLNDLHLSPEYQKKIQMFSDFLL